MPPARSQAHRVNRVHQGWAPVGSLRRKSIWIRNTKISLLCLLTGTMLQNFSALLASSMSYKPPTAFIGMEKLLGALQDGPRAAILNPRMAILNPCIAIL